MRSGKHASPARSKARVQKKRQNWVPWMIAAGVLLILGALAGMVFSQGEPRSIRPARVGSKLSDFSLTAITGEDVRLSDHAGKVVLVNAWATWCPPCVAEMPALNSYYREHAQEGFVILAVNAGDAPADAAAFAREYGIAFPVLLDPQVSLLEGLNVQNFPTSILIGRDGVVKDIHIGMMKPEQIEAKVGPLLAETAFSSP